MNINRISRYYYLKFLRLNGTPQALSRGAAIGVFIGLTPTIPLHTILVLFLTVISRSSFIAGLISSWFVSNPLTYIPQYYFSLKIGNLLTPYHLDWNKMQDLLAVLMSDMSVTQGVDTLLTLGYEAIVIMLTGGIVLALPVSVVSYFFFYSAIGKYRLKKHRKQILH